VGLIEKGRKISPLWAVVVRVITGARKSRFHVEPASYETPSPKVMVSEADVLRAAE
jgi:hypothetical protein